MFAVAIVLIAAFSLLYGGRSRQYYDRLRDIIQVGRGREIAADYQVFSDSLNAQIGATLAELGIWDELISEGKPGKKDVGRILVQVPDDLPLIVCNLELSLLAGRLGGEIVQATEYPTEGKAVLEVGKRGRVTGEIVLSKNRELRRKAGTIAIIVDDFGDDLKLAERFCELAAPITFSVLPYLKYSRQVADLAFNAGYEVMLHLPMEPRDASTNNPGKGAIRVGQSSSQIKELTRNALASVSHARGANNHMGSRATEEPKTVKPMLEELKRRGLFFVDSVNTPKSVVPSTAKGLGVKCARRDVFLDNEQNAIENIKAQILELSRLAIEQQKAIGIGHARENTLTALKQLLPKLEKKGFKFVPASDIVN